MPESAPASAQAEVAVDAHPDAVYALLTDLPTLTALAEETTAMSWHKGDSVRAGAVFKGKNRNGWRSWTTICTVTDAEPGRVFAFDVRSAGLPVAHWRYDIAAGDSGCRVTESTWDRRSPWFAKVAVYLTGVHDRASTNAEHITTTLRRLKQRAEHR